LTQAEIAEALGVSQPMISYDLKIVRRRYIESQIANRAEQVALKLEQYHEVRSEAWAAWERSKADAGNVVEKFADSLGKGEQRIKRIVVREGRLPDNAYLTTIMKTLEAERHLLGLDEQAKGVTADVVMTIINSFAEAARQVLAGHPELLRALNARTMSLLQVPVGEVRAEYRGVSDVEGRT
jgi:predicted transcriptional regulator